MRRTIFLTLMALAVGCETSNDYDGENDESSSSGDYGDESSSDDGEAKPGQDAVGPNALEAEVRPTHPNPCDPRRLPFAG